MRINTWYISSFLISIIVVIPIITIFSSFFQDTSNYFEILKETFNVSATQSVFNITEGQFDEGFLEVYLNGVKLNQSDFTENPPTQFTLDVADESGDVVEIIGFKDRGTNTSISADLTNLNVSGVASLGHNSKATSSSSDTTFKIETTSKLSTLEINILVLIGIIKLIVTFSNIKDGRI